MAKLLIITPTWNMGWQIVGDKILAPPLALPTLAGLTPCEYEVQLVDENVSSVDLNAEVDLVAISFMTASAPRAYEIADAFRSRGIPVVMGGIHPTVMPDEAALHADAVVIGEAEPVWRTLLEDLAAGRLKPRYGTGSFCKLAGWPLPRRDLLSRGRYLTNNVIQTARGCPNACSFCSVWFVAGRKYRFRPVDEVVEELLPMSGQFVGVVDDNIIGNVPRAKELFEAMIPLNLKWVGQSTLGMAEDKELLHLAARSGCHALFVGVESVSQENLRATHKHPNINLNMETAIRTIQRAGIGVIGSFVLGLDGDGPGVFEETLAFAERVRLAAAQFSVLTPFPGTEMREQLEAEDRILDNDWSKYTMSNVVFQPLNMTPEQLQEGQALILRRFYSLPSIFMRSLTVRKRLGPWYLLNFGYHFRGV